MMAQEVEGTTPEVHIYTTLTLANAVGAATAMGRGAGRHVASTEAVRAILVGGYVNGNRQVQ